jgi:hypothetical protein
MISRLASGRYDHDGIAMLSPGLVFIFVMMGTETRKEGRLENCRINVEDACIIRMFDSLPGEIKCGATSQRSK